ncbi:cullin-1-like protein, partial [Trifolium pratense]
MSHFSILDYDEGWNFMQKGIKKLIESLPNPHFTTEDSLMLYTVHTGMCPVHGSTRNVYNMCVQRHPHDYGILLYENYKKTFEDYVGLT